MITPRPYQTDAVDEILRKFRSGVCRQVLVLPTGLGKTICFSLLAKKWNVRTLIVAHREELLEQAKAKMELVWEDASIGIVKAERNEIDRQVVIASVQTICRPNRLEELKRQQFQLLIVDEAHHAPAETYMRVIRELGFFHEDPDLLLLGATATPKRADGTGLDEVFQEIAYSMDIQTAIRAGYLSPPVGRQILTQCDLKGVRMQHGDFIVSELSKVVNTPYRNKLVVEAFKTHASDRKKALAFAVDVQHALDLAQAFNDNGIAAKAVFGAMDDEDRKETLKEFSEGKYQVLTNCMVLTEGFDETAIDCILMCRPTQSEPLFVQCIGRGLRLHPGKQNCLILDLVDNCQKHSLCNIRNSLEGAIKVIADFDESEDAEIIPEYSEDDKPVPVSYAGSREIEFFDRADFAWTCIVGDWHLSISQNQEIWVRRAGDAYEVHAKDGENHIQLSKQPLPLDYAIGIAEDWARKHPKQGWGRKDAAWRKQPASSKQLDALFKLGFEVRSDMTKGEASQLLDSKISEPATSKQLQWLRIKGVDFPKGISKMQAKKLIAEKIKQINTNNLYY